MASKQRQKFFVHWIHNRYIGPGLYFNIDKKGARPVKYGVIHIDALRSDLRNWDSLYASGRMQKPFVVLHSDGSIAEANEVNIANAVKASLLLLPHQFTENDFLETYAGISYMGDIRVKLRAENPDKVGNIGKVVKLLCLTLYSEEPNRAIPRALME